MNQSVTSPGTDTLEKIRAFYADYAEVPDDERMPEWPDFFTEDCVYRIVPRENFDVGSELCMMQAEGRGMLQDRVQGILKTQKFQPQRCRRFFSALKITGIENDVIHVRQNVLAIQSKLGEPSSVLLCGVSHDRLALRDGRVLFQERTLVTDTDVIDDALIIPL